jgi:hypothetical protein
MSGVSLPLGAPKFRHIEIIIVMIDGGVAPIIASQLVSHLTIMSMSMKPNSEMSKTI